MQWSNTLEVSLPGSWLPCHVLFQNMMTCLIGLALAQSLYGTWVAVATSQIVKVLAHWVPPGVTGLLPSRAPSDCAYSAQFELELAAKVRNRCSGIVMDLKKCFNNIRWICGVNFPQRNWSAHSNSSCVDPFDCQHLSILGDSRRILPRRDLYWRFSSGWLMERGGYGGNSYCVGLLSCQHHPRSLAAMLKCVCW